eukprot:TRINITY_DN50054_c0_g1_i1.p1 TRINITY_DN50054_c0_g1~~TRINITY_DN50054_c0_g1_i1.p1  ORF type:complete len:558 (+),score=164.27 TRINITY_DN50054_c0_g1_i1:94-1674(+)
MPRGAPAAAAALLLAGGAAGDPLSDAWFTSSRAEVLQEEALEVVGELPGWLRGSYFKESASVYEERGRSFTNAFDGFGKVLRWRFPGGGAAPTLRARMLQSTWWNDSEAAETIVFGNSVGGMAPPYRPEEVVKGLFHGHTDNFNVAFWDFGPAAGRHVALSDTCHPAGAHIDPDDLGVTEFNWGDKWTSQEFDRMSPAHPQRVLDGSGDTVSLVERINPTAVAGLGDHSIIVYRVVAATGERVKLHTIRTKRLPYVHSIGVTVSYAIICHGPLRWEVPALMEGKSASDSLRWDTGNTTIYLVPLDPAQPVRTFAAAPFFAFHHVNAWEEPNGDVSFDAFHDEGLSAENPSPFQFTLDLRDPARRPEMTSTSTLWRHTLSAASGTTSSRLIPLNSAAGRSMAPELPAVNPSRRGAKYCHLWTWSLGVDGGPWTEAGLLKKDVCREQSLATVWRRPEHFPGEPEFVARPGAAAEDDGVLLSAAHDGRRNATYLLVLNASTMETVAEVRRNGGEQRLMGFGIHGRWYAD